MRFFAVVITCLASSCGIRTPFLPYLATVAADCMSAFAFNGGITAVPISKIPDET